MACQTALSYHSCVLAIHGVQLMGIFGLIKKKFRSSDVNTMADVQECVSSSCAANTPLLYSWQWRAWDTYLSAIFKPVRGIRHFQHFRFASDSPGVVHMRKECHGAEESLVLLKDPSFAERAKEAERPAILPAAGLSEARRLYLEKEIAEYFSDGSLLPWNEQ